jgi:hypothetical protein
MRPQILHLISTPGVVGIQKLYFWKSLESKQGEYDFSEVMADIEVLASANRKLILQLQDRSFSKANRVVPEYLDDPRYITDQGDTDSEGGWVAKQWNSEVRQNFQNLIAALGRDLDGKVAAINLPETSTDLESSMLNRAFIELYFQAAMKNIRFLNNAFRRSQAVQYVNFFPEVPGRGDQTAEFFEKLFSASAREGFAVGGPDTLPCRPGQMYASYPYFNKFSKKVTTFMAVQSPNYKKKNPRGDLPYTISEFYNFAVNYLGADALIWSSKEPEFSEKVVPFLLSLEASSH